MNFTFPTLSIAATSLGDHGSHNALRKEEREKTKLLLSTLIMTLYTYLVKKENNKFSNSHHFLFHAHWSYSAFQKLFFLPLCSESLHQISKYTYNKALCLMITPYLFLNILSPGANQKLFFQGNIIGGIFLQLQFY